MRQFRKDPIIGRWVIVDIDDPLSAGDFEVGKRASSTRTCPFCPGNEGVTPKEIISYSKNGEKNSPDWQIRVIPNKFPALKIEEAPDKFGVGIYDKMGGFGAHEIIIENPYHQRETAQLSREELGLLLKVYRDRCQDLRKDSRFKYILIFKNSGDRAGASLEHPHSQLIGLPVVPSRVLGELKGAQRHYAYRDRCAFCDMIHQERSEQKLTVYENADFLAFEPFASRFPFETWVLPKAHAQDFDAISDEHIDALAEVLRATLMKLCMSLKNPAYNFMIHTAPLEANSHTHFHWHIEIIPHLTSVAGFELGTGFYMNPTTPELCAQTLRLQPLAPESCA